VNRVAPAHVVGVKPELHDSIDGPGHLIVVTRSGTTHEIKNFDALYWRRTPAAGSGDAAYDGRFVRLSRLGPVEVGEAFWLVVSDGSYLYGETDHRSATVTRIRRVGGFCRLCGYRAPLGICWRDAIEPDWMSTGVWGWRYSVRRRIERRLGMMRGARFAAVRRARRFWARVRRGMS
jgi:hypothetical protein